MSTPPNDDFTLRTSSLPPMPPTSPALSAGTSLGHLDFPEGIRGAAEEFKYLSRVETALLQEIQVLQKTLDESRRHAGRSSPTTSSSDRRHQASRARRNQQSAPKRPRARVISASLRIPSKADRESVRQQLFDLALPPKAVLSLESESDQQFVWVGLDDSTEPETSVRQSDTIVRVKHTDDMLQSFLTFSENTLYRVLHYDYSFLAEDSDPTDNSYETYKNVSQIFAETICAIYEEGDLIWVHNHHLMLLPSMIRERLWYAKIGFFLYLAFPSAELYRILPMRVELLKGVVGADLVGFYAYDYAKQFVSACSQLLGMETTPSTIDCDPRTGRKCEIRIYPAGIDVKTLKAHVSTKMLKARVADLREQFADKQIIVSVERLDDCFAGIPLTLLAFEKLMQDNEDFVHKVALVQVAMLPRESKGNGTHRTLMTQINELVGSINAAFGTFTSSPVHYINDELDPSELHALMCASHVCIVSKIRDGMGLVPHEWTVCQHGGHKGPIVLSEFSGCARSFSTALHVNPWDVEEVALKLREALEMDKQARDVQNDIAYRFVSEHTAAMWGLNFLEDLEQMPGAQHGTNHFVTPILDGNIVIRAYRASSSVSAMSSPVSSGIGLSTMAGGESPWSNRLVQGASPTASVSNERSSDSEMPVPSMGSNKSSATSLAGSVGASLGTPTMSRRFQTKKKLFILDYEGTLSQFQPLAEISSPTDRVRRIISRILLASIDNVVLILSGHGRRNLMKWFGDLDVFLAAEDGCFLRPPGDNGWIPLFAQPSNRGTLVTTDSLNDITPFRDPLMGAHFDLNAVGNGSGMSPVGSKDKINGGSADAGLSSGLYKGSLSSMGSYEAASSDGEEKVLKWKANVKQVMEHFAERTPGVLVQEGDTTLTWHFVDTNNEFGRSQVRALQNHLESFLVQNVSMSIVTEEGRNRWLKVRPTGIDKADAVYRTMEIVRESGGRSKIEEVESGEARIDFILCIGDDRADEGMFELLRDEKQQVELGIRGISSRIFTCRVGSAATMAMATVDSTAQVVDLLDELVRRTHGSLTGTKERGGVAVATASSAPV